MLQTHQQKVFLKKQSPRIIEKSVWRRQKLCTQIWKTRHWKKQSFAQKRCWNSLRLPFYAWIYILKEVLPTQKIRRMMVDIFQFIISICVSFFLFFSLCLNPLTLMSVQSSKLSKRLKARKIDFKPHLRYEDCCWRVFWEHFHHSLNWRKKEVIDDNRAKII